MKVSEMREKSDGDLRTEILALRREAFNLRMQQGTGQLSRTSQLGAVRKDIARAKTILTERSKA